MSSDPNHPPTTEACATCAHEWQTHDVIAKRYCTATAAGDYSRGCVCVPQTAAHVKAPTTAGV
ncbi:RGCVC family protein [Actinokineospora sp. 24-640]